MGYTGSSLCSGNISAGPQPKPIKLIVLTAFKPLKFYKTQWESQHKFVSGSQTKSISIKNKEKIIQFQVQYLF
jgi:hypothetical protein